MPPSLQLPRPIEDLNFARKGSRVVLTWTPPTQTTEHLGLKHQGATYICRSVGRYPVNGCDMIKRLSPSDVALVTDKKREQAVFEDVLPNDVIAANAFATYSIEVFNNRGRSAGLSNQVRVSLAPTLAPPQDLQAKVTAQGPVLTWTGVMPTIPGPTYTYRIMRRLQGVPNFAPIDDLPVDVAKTRVYNDRSFEWQKQYDYKIVPITAVAGQGTNIEIEGDDSPVVSVMVNDIFPPSRPIGVQAVFSSVGQKPFIDLTWTPNAETDLAGYDVYRHEQGSEPVKLTAQPVQAPAFRDSDVKPGAKYFYSVVAVDLRGNHSERSEEASESVPAEER